jgi:putative Holliday junction resolvase
MIYDFKKLLDGTDKRIIGLDYGEKRIGIAISDASRTIASPLKVARDEEEARRTIRDNDTGGIVIGLPLEMSGREGETARKARAFGARLADMAPVEFMDERLSSKGAEDMLIREADMTRAKRRRILDKVAAQHILQAYLDLKQP